MIIQGDSLEKLKLLEDSSIDAIVTDPPYGLSFMGKKWDYNVPSKELWTEAYRVLKPGGHLLAFGGTRTYHRLVVNIEDAGFEIRDQIQWLYGSGFPKSHNIGKAIDKMYGMTKLEGTGKTCPDIRANNFSNSDGKERLEIMKSVPQSEDAKQWQGWGTALKPANEPICVARKPLEKGLTVAQNVLKWGTGAINIDECRIEAQDQAVLDAAVKRMTGNAVTNANSKNFLKGQKSVQPISAQGRWPANIILDETAAEMLDEQSGVLKTNSGKAAGSKAGAKSIYGSDLEGKTYDNLKGDSGGASRFFYVAKASKRERGEGNNHPTVKPIKLMEYLIKLVTPPNGTVLDPFMGSGSTGVACKNLGYKFIGIELNPEYVEIAEKRIGA